MTTAEVWNRTYAHELGNLLGGMIAGSLSGADTLFGDPRGIENASRTTTTRIPGHDLKPACSEVLLREQESWINDLWFHYSFSLLDVPL